MGVAGQPFACHFLFVITISLYAWKVNMSPARRSARPVPKVLGERKRADDSVTWGKSSEAIQGSEVEIRHVGDKIVIREI